MAKYTGPERRQKQQSFKGEDKRTAKVHSLNVFTRTDERYQFESLVIRYRAQFNVWQVIDYTRPEYDNILFEVVGYAYQADAFLWAKDFIKERRITEEAEKKNGIKK